MSHPRTLRRTRHPSGRLLARALTVAVLGAAGVVAPVAALPAIAAPTPVKPEAQVVAVPDVPAGADAPDTGAPAPKVLEGGDVDRAQDAPDVAPPPAQGPASVPVPSSDAPVAATGALETDGFHMVSVSWKPDATSAAGQQRSTDAVVQVRVRSEGAWSGWQEVGTEDAGPDPDTAEGRSAATTVATEPLWVSGGADGVDVRVTGQGLDASRDVAVNLIDPKTSPADANPSRSGAPFATADAATVGMPTVISRKQWGADESLRSGSCLRPPETNGPPKVVFVHHTAGTNSYSRDQSAAIVRGIYYYHTQIQKWCDIGYNALVDKYGQIFEGRYGGLDRNLVGAHAAGFNAESWGVSVLGNFETAQSTPAIAEALRSIIGWKMSREHIDPLGTAVLTAAGTYPGQSRFTGGTQVRLRTVSGHRDVGLTSCPGANLYATLPALARSIASSVAEQHWQVRDTATPGDPDHDLYYGAPGSRVLACDPDGDGHDGVAVFVDGAWSMRDDASGGPATRSFRYGGPGTIPVCGDWDGDGKDGIGVYVPATGTWWLRDSASAGPADRVFQYGFRGTLPVTGDWSGSGHDGIGVYDTATGTWYLRGTADAGWYGAKYQYGFAGAQPVTGDWNGDGADSTGVMKDGQWYLRDSITPGDPDRRFGYGVGGDTAVTGSWGPGRTTGTGVVRDFP